MRLAVITSIPTPYRDPFWNVVASRPDVDLDVYYCAPKKADRPWELNWERNYNAIYLPSINFARSFGDDASAYWNKGILGNLKKGNYDAMIIGGYNHPTMLAAMLFAKRNKVPFFLVNEVYLKQPRKAWKVKLKAPLVDWVIRNAAGYLPTGTLSIEYLKHYGANEKNMIRVPNTPDVEGFFEASKKLRKNKAEIKAKLGFGNEKVILFVSRLIHLKRVDLIIRAMDLIRDKTDAKVAILGDGPARAEWEALTKELNLEDRILYFGFMDPSELDQWYAMADLFTLTSEDETWSVVVLEALASGLPVVITDMVGCYKDMINDPVVGSVVPSGEYKPLADAFLQQLNKATPPEDVYRVWEPIRQTVRYEHVAENLISGIKRIIGKA